jgi:transposase
MMGQHGQQQEIWAEPVNLGKLIPEDDPLRKINRILKLDFVREEVAPFYGRNGNESVDPVIIVKLMLLLFLDDVASERELLRVTAMRIDYRWFLGYDLTDAVPHHSVLSKARRKWGVDIFQRLFERVVTQCVEADLVDGSKIHLDSSLVNAHAALKTVRKFSAEEIAAVCARTSERLDEPKESWRSSTDPQAAVIRQGHQPSRPRYKTHRSVEDKSGVVTAVETTPGDVDEGQKMMTLVKQHHHTTGARAATVIADCKYGTVENFVVAQQQGLTTHMADLARSQNRSGRPEAIFSSEAFHYDEKTDTYVCPANQRLYRRNYHPARHYWEYAGRKEVCSSCSLRPACTRNKKARTLNRHEQQALLDKGRKQSLSEAGRSDRKRRQHWMEGSFADAANNHGIKRARWRGLWKQTIQDLLIATCQNLRKLGKAFWRFIFRLITMRGQLETALRPIITSCYLFVRGRKTDPFCC